MTSTKTADLYLRLSDARREEALDGREAKLRAEAARLGWTVGRVIVENDLSPAARNGSGSGNGQLRPASALKRKKITTPSGRVELRTVRPGFRSMLDDIADGRANAVLAEDLDRVCRDPRDLEDLIDACEQHRASARSLSGSLTFTDGGTDAEISNARLMVTMANKSSRDTARRVADSRERLAGQSYHGGQRPYGYRHDPDAPEYHKTLIIVPEEAAVIEKAAEDILNRDVSLKAIAAALRADGVPTVTGTPWAASTLRDALVKPCLAGIAVWHGTERPTPAPWPAILERDVWQRLCDKLTDPARRTNGQTGNAPRWLVSKIALCGICADGKATVHATAGGGRPPAYRCDEYNHLWRDARHTDELVAARVIALIERDGPHLLKPPPRQDTDAAALRAEARKLRERKAAQVRMHAAGDLDDADLAAGMRVIRDRLAAVETQLAASDQPDLLPEFRDPDADALAVWDALGLARQRAVVKLLYTVEILPAGRRGPGFSPDTIRLTRRATV